MASKLLITDASSSLGQALYRAFEHTSYSLLTPHKSELDCTDLEAFSRYTQRYQPAIVINTVGWSETPNVIKQEELIKAAEVVAEICLQQDIIPIHLSSYRVFGGDNKSSYDEEDSTAPISAAGYAFVQAEQSFVQLPKHLCVRLSWVMDIKGDSIFHRLLDDLTSEGEPLEVSHMRRGTPVSLKRVGKLIVAMVNQILCGADNWGVFHFASGDPCSSAEFAEAVMEILKKEGLLKRQLLVEPVSENDSGVSVEPLSAALTVRRCRDDFGVQVGSWRQGLTALIRDWKESTRELFPPES